jgi:hypothetical protein
MDAMQELRDYVKTRITILEADVDAKPEALSDAAKELVELEKAIARHQPMQAECSRSDGH